jgi:pilus assembly protein CpaE
MPKRPEVRTADFAKALEAEPVAIVPFDPQVFGTAANNGQMIAEVSAKHKTAEIFLAIAKAITGRAEVKKQKRDLLSPLLAKLRGK